MNVISLSVLFVWPRSFEQMIEEIRKDRNLEELPDAWDIVDDGPTKFSKCRIIKLKQLAESGYKFTAHCPFRPLDFINPDDTIRKESLNKLMQSMYDVSELSPLVYVIHPSDFPNGKAVEDVKVQHFEFLEKIFDYAKSIGINASVENHIPRNNHMFTTPKEFLEFYERTGSQMGMTYDTGHANLNGTSKEFVDKLEKRMAVVHVHDNNGMEDEHLMIGKGNIDWAYIIGKLNKEIFSGLYVIESIQEPFNCVKILKKMINDGL